MKTHNASFRKKILNEISDNTNACLLLKKAHKIFFLHNVYIAEIYLKASINKHNPETTKKIKKNLRNLIEKKTRINKIKPRKCNQDYKYYSLKLSKSYI